MITPEEISKKLGLFSEEDRTQLESIKNTIEKLINLKTLNIEAIDEIKSSSRELDMIYSSWIRRYINLLKNGVRI